MDEWSFGCGGIGGFIGLRGIGGHSVVEDWVGFGRVRWMSGHSVVEELEGFVM